MKNGEAIYFIRKNKGYSQKYVAGDTMTQGAYSKFEKLNSEIRHSALMNILNKLEVSPDEFMYIKQGYEHSIKDKMLNKLFTLTYNNTEVLQQPLSEAEIYLEENDDILIKDLCLVCKSLIVLSQTKDIVAARVSLYKVWQRLSQRDLLFINDIYFVNFILYLFPLETALEIKKFVYRSIDKYKNFRNIERLKVNMAINMTLLLIKEDRYIEALIEVEEAIALCKRFSDYKRLAVCYLRKGICLNNLKVTKGDQWISKGKNILIAIDELKILNELEDEVNRFNKIL
ncbi:helix-turn-helix transcriptional regulator [Psychrobacillus sp. FSL K6-2684]|uniref:helix-turn-helix domain-containing protein n=1 Tax=Psychrobacillus sp. FSL K6-2684 TaxID=2921547 RepID=UPI0030FCB09D